MTTNVKATPQGYHTVTPYMAVRDCVAAIDVIDVRSARKR